jgi:hypothetical protein
VEPLGEDDRRGNADAGRDCDPPFFALKADERLGAVLRPERREDPRPNGFTPGGFPVEPKAGAEDRLHPEEFERLVAPTS